MPKYRKRTQLSTSGYQSEGGTQYVEDCLLGKGSNARARKFTAKNKAIAVLNPVDEEDVDFAEAKNKFEFFKVLYPSQDIKFFNKRNDYRLILPLIPGLPFHKIKKNNKITAKLFLSAVLTLQECHQNGYVVLDLKQDNILFDQMTNRSYLIDGGMASKINGPVNNRLRRKNSLDLDWLKNEYWHIAPECWSDINTNVIAQPSMDVYSLGKLFQFEKNVDEDIKQLLDSCISLNPDTRPTLHDLEKSLKMILTARYQRVKSVIASFGIQLNNELFNKLLNNSILLDLIIQIDEGCMRLKRELIDIESINSYQARVLFILLGNSVDPKNDYLNLKNSVISEINDEEFSQFANAIGTKLDWALLGIAHTGLIPNSNLCKGFSLFHYSPEDIVFGNKTANAIVCKKTG